MKKLVYLALGMFTVGSSSFIIAGILPQISSTLEQSIAVTGQGITSFSLAYLFSAPVFSFFSVNSRVKNAIQIALTLLLLGNLITIISDNITLFLIGRAITGIGAGIFTPLCVTIAINIGGHSAKGRALSFVWGANSAGVVFGVPFGLYLASSFNWQVSISFIAVLILFALIGFSLQHIDAKLPAPSLFGERIQLLLNKKIIAVISVTCFTSMACLGLYSYIAPIQSGAPDSLAVALFAWGLGAFTGSSLVGFFIDKTKKPQFIMTVILLGLIFTFITLPFTKGLTYLGLVPFFLWGALSWATTTPQQHTLFELQENQGAILAALNASAIGLGGALGTAVAGSMIASGLQEAYLPFFAAALLIATLVFYSFFTNILNKGYNI